MASKLHRSPLLDPEPSRRVRLCNDSDVGGISQRHIPPGKITSIPVLRRRGRIPPRGPLPSSSDSDSWLTLYGWVLFVNTLFQDDNGKGPEILVTLVRLELINVNDGSILQVY